jgi:lysophospholipase L1-like esterase
VGSSSIRGWDLPKYFPKWPTINRGFGGSQLHDAVHFLDRIVLPYRPRVVVLYAGDNDIAGGRRPKQVWMDFRDFVTRVRAALPDTQIVYIAIKPSPARWKLVGDMRRANELIRALIQTDPRLHYVDVDRPMLGPDGQPRRKLYQQDGLHLTRPATSCGRAWSSHT